VSTLSQNLWGLRARQDLFGRCPQVMVDPNVRGVVGVEGQGQVEGQGRVGSQGQVEGQERVEGLVCGKGGGMEGLKVRDVGGSKALCR
jgi:hypothetical protein